MIRFSVLVSVYIKDSSSFLEQALDSIFNQSLLPSEIVLVEDGPISKELDETIGKFQTKEVIPIKRVRIQKNIGLGGALNLGLKHCSYDYVARMDADDINLPERFAKQVNFIESNPAISVVGGYIEEFDKLPGDLHRIKKVPLQSAEISKAIYSRNPLNHVTVMFKKADVELCDSYDDVMFFEDYFLWFKLEKRGFKMANLAETLLYVRVGNNMIGRRHGWSYLKKEYAFIVKALHSNLISRKQALLMTFFRFPVRLMPKFVISGVYRFILR